MKIEVVYSGSVELEVPEEFEEITAAELGTFEAEEKDGYYAFMDWVYDQLPYEVEVDDWYPVR